MTGEGNVGRFLDPRPRIISKYAGADDLETIDAMWNHFGLDSSHFHPTMRGYFFGFLLLLRSISFQVFQWYQRKKSDAKVIFDI